MIRKLLSIIFLTLVSLAQMNPIAPDVSYTGKNDRYDLTDMVSAHKKMFRDTPLVDDDEGGGNRRHLKRRVIIDFAYDPDNRTTIDGAGDHKVEFRRLLSKNYSEIIVNSFEKENHPQAHLTRRADGTFAEDDSKNSFEGGTVSDFEDNLKKFQMNKSLRRRKVNGGEELFENVVVQNVPYSNDN